MNSTLEFLLGMVLITPIFVVGWFMKKESEDLTRDMFKMHRDQKMAFKGEYDENNSAS